MIVFDLEVFKHDWMIVWLDLNTRKKYHIVNDKEKMERFYAKYKDEVWIGYNCRNYDQWIVKAILCGFDPYQMNDWIINKDRKGFEFSKLLNNFPIITFDVMQFGRSLKQLEGFMGHDIRETSVPFDIDRKLTKQEISKSLGYCEHDVMETFHVFVETKEDYETNLELVRKYNLGLEAMSKTQTQLTAMVLGASKRTYNDEFDIKIPDTLRLGKYEYLKDWYIDWSQNVKSYDAKLETEIAGVLHVFGLGGLHGAIPKYVGEGIFLMADVGSYYPSLMIEYDYHSRSIGQKGKAKFKEVYNTRMKLKAQKKKKEQLPYKLVLNKTYGGLKDKYNPLYDPVQANNVCIAGQLFLVDLIDKLEGKCELVQSNTDGILLRLYSEDDRAEIMAICDEWSKRTRMTLEFDDYRKVIQKDVNNYITVGADGTVKRKGSYTKVLSSMDNDLPIVNKAIVNWFVHGIRPEQTIMEAEYLIDFQKIVKISSIYEFAFKGDTTRPIGFRGTRMTKDSGTPEAYHGDILNEKVHRVFASKLASDGTLYKKHKEKSSLDKTPSTPVYCYIDNTDITNKKVPERLDRQWYIDLALSRIGEFM